MPKPVTGLPVAAMPSTTRFVHESSMPITTTAATFGLQPVPISVRKCSSRSAPNWSRPYGCGIASAPLMLCATASAAAFDRSSRGSTITWLRTPMRPFSRRQPRNVVSFEITVMASPALGLDVVHVGMLARLDRRDDAAHVDAVLDDGLAHGHVLQRHLVADRDVLARTQLGEAVVVHHPAGH